MVKKTQIRKKVVEDPSNNVEVIEGLGVRLERHGRAILVSSSQNPQELNELRNRLKELIQEVPSKIKQQSQEVEKILSQFNSFDIIAQIFFVNYVTNPETYIEYLHEGNSAIVEYVTLLCLKRPFFEGTKKFIDGKDIDSIQKPVAEIIQDANLLFLNVPLNPDKSEPSTEELNLLQYQTRINELQVRNPGYDIHLYEVLSGLFTPFDKLLLEIIGFTVSDTIQLSKAAGKLIIQKLYTRRDLSITEFGNLTRIVRNYRKTNQIPDDCKVPEDVLDKLTHLSDKELRKSIKNLSVLWTFQSLGDTFSYSIDELAKYSGVSPDRVKMILDRLSLKFCDIKPDFYIPELTHPLKECPFIVQKERYMCPAPSLLGWSIQPMLEGALKLLSSNRWDKYIKHRHDYLLNRSIELMNNIMPRALFEMNLEYSVSDGGVIKDFELDGLGVYDSVLFLIEAKGGSMTPAARRGAPDRLITSLKKIIGEAHIQATRVKRYIDSSPEPIFKRQGNSSIFKLDKGNIRNVFLISLSLEPIGHLTSMIHAETSLGIFFSDHFPWMVNLYDLMVISGCIDYPPLFPHYIKRRIRSIEQGFIEAHDELDIFGYYLKEGLYFESSKDIAPASKFRLLSYTTEFDSYYFYKSGIRRSFAPKPQPKISDDCRRLLNAVEGSNENGRISVAMAILDLSGKSRDELIAFIKKTKQKYRRDGLNHDATIMGEGDTGWGITYMVGPQKDFVISRLKEYCYLKKYQVKADTFYGIGDTGAKNFQVCSIISLKYPWVYDSSKDQEVRSKLPDHPIVVSE